MNGVNTLFVISCIFVPLLLISLNYQTIHDFYEYSVPLNGLEIYENDFDKNFNEIIEKKDAQCITTPMNYFCYAKPIFHGNMEGISYIVSEDNLITGEMHFNPTENGASLFIIQNMTEMKENTALILFSNARYFIDNAWTPPLSFGGINEIFEYSTTIKKFDTFISHCNNPEGTSVTLIQYLGIQTINDIDYFVAWHTTADSESGINCDYPQIIKHSIDHDFGL